MPTYDYHCQSCGVYHELVCSISQRKDEIECPRCRGVAEQVILTAPAVATSSMSNVTQDVAIGRDAEKRWERIHAKKEKRDKIRKESGNVNLTAVGVNEYKPSDKKLRFVETKGTEKYD
jgi:putative FmdB family regulatory protein